MQTTKRQRYACPVLGSVAIVHITTYYHQSDEMKQAVPHGQAFTGCENMLQCGIAKQVAYGTWVPDWTACPAHPDYKEADRP